MQTTFAFGPPPPEIDFRMDPSGDVRPAGEEASGYLDGRENAFNVDTKPVYTWKDLLDDLEKREVESDRSRKKKLEEDKRSQGTWDDWGTLNLLNFIDSGDPIHWQRGLRNQKEKQEERRKQIEDIEESLSSKFNQFTGRLREVIDTADARKFFDKYVEACRNGRGNPWLYPCIVPEVWINWVTDEDERASLLGHQQFRVDFLLRHEAIGPNVAIIEIDGSSHYTERSYNPEDGYTYEPSDERYTEHIRKDRWLRSQGFHVYRITNLEVREMCDVCSFLWTAVGLPLDPVADSV